MQCSEDDALRIANNLFKKYSNGTKISENNLSRMLTDLYSDQEKEIDIGPEQVEEYKMVLDIDQDQSVTFQDILNLIKKYLIDDSDKIETVHHQTEEIIESTIVTTFHIPKQKIEPVQIVTQQKAEKIEQAPQQQQKAEKIGYASQQQQKAPPQQDSERKYNQRTLNKLDLAKRLFNQFQQNGFITKYEVPGFLRETYKSIGMSSEVTREDVDQWMVMADRDNDGRVYYGDFEIMLIESLKESGLEIFK